ncbi:MAG: TonB-dependent receptor, partial [Opitutae bacterium]|nr:TonB-dependent receptor [Opitutae bacterium]
MIKRLRWSKRALFAMLSIALPLSFHAYAQEEEDEEEIFELSPFTIDATQDEGYLATTTLAGTRIRTSTRDIGASISIITEEFLEDTGATDAESLLYHVGNVDVGGVLGNYSNANLDNSSTAVSRAVPQRGQRIRGLVRATRTR